jgi:hypothetical protein
MVACPRWLPGSLFGYDLAYDVSITAPLEGLSRFHGETGGGDHMASSMLSNWARKFPHLALGSP